MKRLEEVDTDEDHASEQLECPPDTGNRDIRLAVLQVEKAHLEEDRERLHKEVDRLRRELADERGKREDERSEFMALLRQKEETVQLLTDRTNRAKRPWWQRSKAATVHPAENWAHTRLEVKMALCQEPVAEFPAEAT